MSNSLGIFDSGLGGLTVLKQILTVNGYDRIVYFGDTGRVPYGTRSRETIQKYAMQDVRFLLSKQIDEIIIACGTVSANAID
ncbi:MAG: glutamate racemase, partial [Firmicutes bacterium]|nr:glutamate racemase [Bacillota bacterium]